MGSQPSKPSKPSVDTNESEKSARNVLENIGSGIKDKRKNQSKYTDKLKGILTKAKFVDELSSRYGFVRDSDGNSCNLDHLFHTNINTGYPEGRKPCYERNEKRFGENAEAYCNSDKIRDNGERSAGGACAPYRRQNLCDRNLEYLINENTKTTHDLLGNVLVTAKYEGDIIVNNHPDKNSSGNKSSICTSLARSFADIGDIVRGRDMFKPNPQDKVQKGLREVFRKIHKSLSPEVQKHYEDDGSGNYYKLREAWWMANRDQVWRAITCKAPQDANYFRKISGDTKVFTSQGQCGHSETNVPTNLDYVPQFLRWFNEWAEDFCRIRKIKMDKIKKECRGEYDSGLKRYCSGDGYDCTQTDISRNILFVDLDCPNCEKACRNYQKWIENQENEFSKQKNKYTKEIEKLKDNSKSNYDKNFYLTLTKKYGSINLFLDTLKEGSHCSYNTIEDKIDFNKANQTFTSSKFCGACPFYGVKCNRTKCTHVEKDEYERNKKSDSKHKKGQSTAIDVLVTHNRGKNIPEDLKKVCQKSGFFKGIRNQKWTCEYKNQIDECKVTGFVKDIDVDDRISFKVLFERWLRNFIKDYNNAKEKINICVNNENTKEKTCIKKCKEHCDCVEKWIKKKEVEWDKINQHYNQQKKHYTYSVPSWVNSYLTHQHFSSDFINALEAFKNIRGLENLKQCNENTCKIEKIRKINEDLIKELISKLKDKCAMCKNQHDDNKGQKCCIKMPKSENGEDEELHTTKNPCVNGQNQKVVKIKRVRRVAKRMQKQASVRHDGDISKLKADASLGTYSRGGSPSAFKNVCSITKNDSNDSRSHGEPCTGKDGYDKMFEINEGWKSGNKIKTPDDVFLPPRREHFCTSNLENLNTKSEGLTGSNASHSLLGDVLLSAKYEADYIKKKYKKDETPGGFKDEETICRAIKYSFADIGDIIKGTDMWDKNPGENKTQGNLVKIFEKIKEKNGGGTKGKYTKCNSPYLELRKDWWEANRSQVWDAMKCHIEDLHDKTANPSPRNHCGYSDHTPLDDYVPQRLRWMTEWAEWYCKVQKKEYDKLVTGCNGYECNGKNDENGKKEQCETACKVYKNFINNWKPQWTQQSEKYNKLYTQGTTNGVYGDVDEKEKKLLEYFKKLNEPNGNTYSTAGKYINKKGYIQDCKEQKNFDENKNGGSENKYAFKDYPNVYDEACNCNDRKTFKQVELEEMEDEDASPPVQKKGKKEAPATPALCDKVKTLLDQSNGGRNAIFGCNPKTTEKSWQCENRRLVSGQGECMPPRRQCLCLHDLTVESDIRDKETLRDPFIRCVAKEIHFLWHKYKRNKNIQDDELKNGKIPEDFKRIMYYTFGDYRDILFDTDISVKSEHILSVKNNIDKVFANKKDLSEREAWWKTNGPKIWEWMLCALTHEIDDEKKNLIKSTYSYETLNKATTNGTPSLDDFAKKPQFLRWYIEWSDEF
ncbi:hypothetical protein PFTANZ_05825, partial [Plasmodium falciparum Tanzania (2000708)]